MIKHSRQGGLPKECNPRVEVCLCEQPDSTKVKNYATGKWEDDQFDENKGSNLVTRAGLSLHVFWNSKKNHVL